MAGPKPTLSLGMGMYTETKQVQRLEQRLTFEQQHPLLELMAFYERARPLKMSVTDTRDGRTAEVEYVIAPRRLMDYVKEGEPYGISVADMIFVSDKTPLNLAPIVAFKLYEERFIDAGLDESGRVRHLKAALDSVRLATLMGLTPVEIREFVEKLITNDPTGIIEADPLVRKYMGVPSWKVPEKAAYLDAHMANWRVRQSKEFGAMLGQYEEGQRCYRDFRVCKADIILGRAGHVNPYLMGQFIRMASTIPLGVPFEVDRGMSGPAYALTEEMCGVDLIRFVEGRPLALGRNDVVRSNSEHAAERTWRSLVVRVESQLLVLERGIDSKIGALRGRVDNLAIELERKRDEIRTLVAAGPADASLGEEAKTNVIQLGEASARLFARAKGALDELGEEISVLEGLKKAVGANP